MEIQSLEHIDFDRLHRGFQAAFCDYAISFDKEELRSMLERRGYVPRLSFAAFEGDEIVAFTLNAIGTFEGVATAYDTGTGTSPAWRGRGLAGEIFARALPHLRQEGVGQYLLEVLRSNGAAIEVYRRMGFEVARELDCFRQSVDEIAPCHAAPCRVVEVDAERVAEVRTVLDFRPSWQNGIESIVRGRRGLVCLGAFDGAILAGYSVFDPVTGDVAQIAVRPEARRRGVASQLLGEAVARMKAAAVKVLNVDARDSAMHSFLANRNIAPAANQLEMIRVIGNEERN